MCAKFLQKILNSTAVGACQSFRQITWFLGNNRALSTFRYRILQHLISIKMFFQMIKKALPGSLMTNNLQKPDL